jgi:hypothetical protein
VPPSNSPCRARPAAANFSAVQSKPQLLCWLTCDGVHIDPGTGKHTILGVFSNIRGRQFPVTHPFMIWFLTLSDAPAGEHKIKISMGLDLSQQQPLIERPFMSQGPLQRINLINEIRNLTFPQPGDYSIIIEVDDEMLLATSLTVSS